MQNKNYEIRNLEWDTNFFGINSAKVILNNEINSKDVFKIKDEIKKQKYDFITIENKKNNNNNNFLIQKFDNTFLADVNIQFIKKNLKYNLNIEKKENVCIDNSLKINNQILEISKKSFIYSRFKNDDRLKNGDKIYYEWTKNSFEKENKYFCYYKEKENILGFILFSTEDNILTVELIAMNSKNKGKGIGTVLYQSLENYAVDNSIKIIKVGTQLNNIIAQNFYLKCGFKHKENNSIYHCWR